MWFMLLVNHTDSHSLDLQLFIAAIRKQAIPEVSLNKNTNAKFLLVILYTFTAVCVRYFHDAAF